MLVVLICIRVNTYIKTVFSTYSQECNLYSHKRNMYSHRINMYSHTFTLYSQELHTYLHEYVLDIWPIQPNLT